jgi:hypothetical protein
MFPKMVIRMIPMAGIVRNMAMGQGIELVSAVPPDAFC